jgi:2-polyprenyl-3-methyl-5-hydroxy-6-metoxy-1,4-benzoquinol methylase
MTKALVWLALFATDSSWIEFSKWFSKEGIPGAPAEVVSAYEATLKTRGVTEEEAQARGREVQAYMSAHPREALTLHFDRIYTWAEAPFSREASALVKKVASTRKPGRALDIAMGQGRNAIWLAKAGWTVSGYDLSGEALRQANAGASAAGVKIETRLASHDEYDLGQPQWDLIVMSFAFTNLSDAAYMRKVWDSLQPGGVLVIEGFNGGPRREPNMILKAFLDYHVLLFEDLPDVADWGRIKAPLLRMAVEKP